MAPNRIQGPGGNWFVKKTWCRTSYVRLPLAIGHVRLAAAYYFLLIYLYILILAFNSFTTAVTDRPIPMMKGHSEIFLSNRLTVSTEKKMEPIKNFKKEKRQLFLILVVGDQISTFCMIADGFQIIRVPCWKVTEIWFFHASMGILTTVILKILPTTANSKKMLTVVNSAEFCLYDLWFFVKARDFSEVRIVFIKAQGFFGAQSFSRKREIFPKVRPVFWESTRF